MASELEWIAAVVGSPDGPAVIVWYEPATDLVIDIRIMGGGFADVPALFARATEEPGAGEPRRPTRVRVADEQLAAALRTIPGLEVVLGDISEAREMLESFGSYVATMELAPEISLGTWERFFAAAAAFYRARPWDAIPSDEWLEVDCERLGITHGALTVVGQQGTTYGLTLLRTAEDAALWMEAGERRERGEPATFPHEFFMLGFNDEGEVDPDEVEAIASKGWDVADRSAYPSLTVLDDQPKGRLPTDDEMAGVTTVLEGLTSFVADEPDLAGAWGGEPIEWQGEVRGSRVRLAAPLELPDDSLVARLAARMDVPDEMLAVAEMLVEFAAAYQDAAFETITARELEALLLETIPAQLAIESTEAPRIMRAARELLALVGNTTLAGTLDAAFEQRLVRELDNPANFAPGKQLVMAGIAAGYDMSTEEGVEEFVEAFAREHAANTKPAAKKKPKPAAKKKPKPAAKKQAKPAAKKPAKPAAKKHAKPAAKKKAKPAAKKPAKPAAKKQPKSAAKKKR